MVCPDLKSLENDLDSIGISPVKGWVIIKHYSPSTYFKPKSFKDVERYVINFFVVGARNFHHAMKIYHENAFPDTRYKFWNSPENLEIIKDEKSFMEHWVTEYSNHGRKWDGLLDAQMISGLEGRDSIPFFAKMDSENPFAIVEFLKKKFINSEEKFEFVLGYGSNFTLEYKKY